MIAELLRSLSGERTRTEVPSKRWPRNLFSEVEELRAKNLGGKDAYYRIVGKAPSERAAKKAFQNKHMSLVVEELLWNSTWGREEVKSFIPQWIGKDDYGMLIIGNPLCQARFYPLGSGIFIIVM